MSQFTRTARAVYEQQQGLPLSGMAWRLNEAVRCVTDYVLWAGGLGPYAEAVRQASPSEVARLRRNRKVGQALEQEGMG